MKRRSFLKALAAAVGARLSPEVAAKPDYYLGPKVTIEDIPEPLRAQVFGESVFEKYLPACCKPLDSDRKCG